MTIAADDAPILIYLHFTDNSPSEESELELADGSKTPVIWKDVLVEGEYPYTPGPTGPIKRKLTVVHEGESSREQNTVAMSDLIDAHEDGAFKYVTIPTTHRDKVLDNTGYVPRPKGLRVVEKAVDGVQKKVMQAALGFTEPDIKGKVQRGTIPDCSAGIFYNWLNKHKDKRYRSAMKHVALTPTPFMGNLDAFAPVFANDEEIDQDNLVVQHFFQEEEEAGSKERGEKAEIIWIESRSLNTLRSKVEEGLNPPLPQPSGDNGEEPVVELPKPARAHYYVEDIDQDNNALASEYFQGKSTRFVIPFSVDDDGNVSISPATRWMEVKQAMIAASDDEFQSAHELQDKLNDRIKSVYGADCRLLVDDLSLDRRVKIVNERTKAEYLASFTMLSDEIYIEPSDTWERIKAPEQAVKSVATHTGKVVLSDMPDLSTPEGRVAAARLRRKKLSTR